MILNVTKLYIIKEKNMKQCFCLNKIIHVNKMTDKKHFDVSLMFCNSQYGPFGINWSFLVNHYI